MKLVTFTHGDRTRIGAVVGELVVDLSAAAPELPTDMVDFLAAGDAAMERAREAQTDADHALALNDVELLAPVPRPGKILAIGLNYRDHAIESGMEIPEIPTVFTKYENAVCGHGDPIILPTVSKRVDYEAELAFVIGKQAKNVKAADWDDYVFGYTCVHDVSARDYQLATSQWTIGKTFDSFGPMGPSLVSKDEIDDVNSLRIWFDLNGEVLQDSNTNQLVFDVPTLVQYLSEVMTLEPGDIVSTGTPPGVGMARKPPIFLKPGDVCTVGIEKIGELVNPCVAEDE